MSSPEKQRLPPIRRPPASESAAGAANAAEDEFVPANEVVPIVEASAPARPAPIAAPVDAERPIEAAFAPAPQQPVIGQDDVANLPAVERFSGPITLHEDESEILRGGFGGRTPVAWIIAMSIPASIAVIVCVMALVMGGMDATAVAGAGICFSVTVVMFLALASPPWLASGRYCLTTHRLFWKPRLGRGYAVPVEWLRHCDIRIGVISSALKLRGPVQLTMRCISKLERLWGAATLMQNIDPAALRGGQEPLRDVVVCPGGAVTTSLNAATLTGTVVMRGDYVALLPYRPGQTLLGTLGRIGGHLAGAAVGVHRYRVERILPFDQFVMLAARSAPEQFDAFVRRCAATFGGLVWSSQQARAQRVRLPHNPEHPSIRFLSGNQILTAQPRDEQTKTIDKLAESWQSAGGPIEEVAGPNLYRRAAIAAAVGLSLALACALMIYAGLWGDTEKGNPLQVVIVLTGIGGFIGIFTGVVGFLAASGSIELRRG